MARGYHHQTSMERFTRRWFNQICFIGWRQCQLLIPCEENGSGRDEDRLAWGHTLRDLASNQNIRDTLEKCKEAGLRWVGQVKRRDQDHVKTNAGYNTAWMTKKRTTEAELSESQKMQTITGVQGKIWSAATISQLGGII